ncbi:MAG: hypothetical protein H6737_25965 [Alphaproteobacteria bacterium]|nr:hypothetical protein [Alphaproteobacteria bacterium]
MLALLLLGCTEKIGLVTGIVLVGPGEVGSPLQDGTVRILGDAAEPFDEGITDRDGRFEATAPLGLNIFAVIEGEGMTPSVFSGTMGQGDLVLPAGNLFAWPETERAALDATFAGCSGPGAVITGEVRLFGATDDNGVSPLITNAFAWVETPDGERIDACYLDEDGEAWAPDAPNAGPQGRYAVFGLQRGFHQLVYGYHITEDIPLEHRLTLWVEDDSVVPQYPAWADLFAP